jgi:hypothetical protein
MKDKLDFKLFWNTVVYKYYGEAMMSLVAEIEAALLTTTTTSALRR